MNRVNLIGNLARDPFVSGKVTRFKLVTNYGFDKKNNKYKKVFVPVVAFGLTEEQKMTLKKGGLIVLEGIVAESSYKKNASTIYQTSVQIQSSGLKLA